MEEEAHLQYLHANADPRVVNPALRQYFSDVVVLMPDGSKQSIGQATREGRAMHERFFDLVREAVLDEVDPLRDDRVVSQMNSYLDRRQAITEALDKYVAGH